MKKTTGLVGLILLVLLVSGLNFAFADEIDDLRTQLLEALDGSVFDLVYADPDVVKAAIKLGNIGNPRAIQVLIEGLKTVWDKAAPYSSASTIDKLEQFSDPISSALTKSLVNLDKQNPSELDDLIPDLINLFENTTSAPDKYYKNLQDFPVSLAALDCLVEIAKQNPDRADEIENIFLNAIKNENDHTQRYAAWALGELNVPEAIPYLLKISKNENPWIYRKNAIGALGKIGSPDAIDTLINILEDENESTYIRTYTIESLGQIGKKNPGEVSKIVPSLIEAMGDDSQATIAHDTISEKASEALNTIGTPAVPYLIQEFKENGNQDIRKKIVQILGKIGDIAAIPVLTDAAKNDSDPYVRSYSVETLANIATEHPDTAKKIVPTLIELLGDKGGLSFYKSIGAMAGDALVKIGKQNLDAVMKPLQEFIINGGGNDQATSFAKKILIILEAPVPEEPEAYLNNNPKMLNNDDNDNNIGIENDTVAFDSFNNLM